MMVLKRNGNGHQDIDPITEVLHDRRKIAAAKLMDQTVASAETEALEAQNKRLQAEIDHQHLLEQTNQSKPGNPWTEYMMGQMQSLQGQLMDMNQRAAERDRELYEERMKMLQEELVRLKEQGSVEVDPMDTTMQTIERSLALADKIRPPAPVVEKGPASDDPHLMAWMKKADQEHELRMEEIRESRELRREELRLKQEQIDREDAREREKQQQMLRFYTDNAPKALEVIQTLVGVWTKSTQVTVASVAPQVAADAAPTASVAQPPPGGMVGQCRSCGAVIVYMPNWPGVGCSNCGAYYQNTPDEQPQEQAPVETEAQPQPSYAGD